MTTRRSFLGGTAQLGAVAVIGGTRRLGVGEPAREDGPRGVREKMRHWRYRQYRIVRLSLINECSAKTDVCNSTARSVSLSLHDWDTPRWTIYSIDSRGDSPGRDHDLAKRS